MKLHLLLFLVVVVGCSAIRHPTLQPHHHDQQEEPRLILGEVTLTPSSQPSLAVRHCDFDAFVTPLTTNDDFRFILIPALNQNKNGVSIQSFNYPERFIAPDPNISEFGRLGIVTSPNVDDASFLIVAGLSSSSLSSFQSLSTGSYHGMYITYDSSLLSGTCSSEYKYPSGDLFLTNGTDKAGATWNIVVAPPLTPAVITIITTNVTHQLNPYIMGCHSDSGYTHQPRGFYSQMIFGESFEEKWNVVVSAGVSATQKLDSTIPFNNKPSMSLQFISGTGFAGLSNRGLGNEGLVFQANSNYEVEMYVLSSDNVKLTARIDDYVNNKILANYDLNLESTSGEWKKLSFDLVPSQETVCVGIVPGSDPNIDCGSMSDEPGHICVRCSGQFSVGLSSVGTVHIGYVFVQPGSWGRFVDLPVLLSAVQNLKEMGITTIRQGGTFAQVMKWKDWRGPAVQRPSMQLTWGASLVSGWGPFEFIDLCNNAGILPIITLSEDQTPQDWADLVEYCFGGINTTWGSQRIADGHESFYDVKVFELGNEQYNNNWVNQVKAMEDKASSLGLAGQVYYMFPTNEGLSATDAQRALDLGLPADHIMPDIHVGAGGAIDVAVSDFNNLPNFHQSAINCETNAGTHHQLRALSEAADLNDWFNMQPPLSFRLKARTASFCTERSGHYDAFDQGLSFFLPNMTWLQPPGYVHKMISETWMPQALSYNVTSIASGESLSAQKSEDGKTVVVRFVNQNPVSTTLELQFVDFTPLNVVRWTLAANMLSAANPPSDPTQISPVRSTFNWTNGQKLDIETYSYTVLMFSSQ